MNSDNHSTSSSADDQDNICIVTEETLPEASDKQYLDDKMTDYFKFKKIYQTEDVVTLNSNAMLGKEVDFSKAQKDMFSFTYMFQLKVFIYFSQT